MAEQREQEKAVALIAIDRVTREIGRLHSALTARLGRVPVSTDANGWTIFEWGAPDDAVIGVLDPVWDRDSVLQAVARCFPKYLSDMSAAIDAYETLGAVQARWKAAPWSGVIGGDPENDKACNTLFKFYSRIAPLQPHARAERDPNDNFRELKIADNI